jgi:hypothetical protein
LRTRKKISIAQRIGSKYPRLSTKLAEELLMLCVPVKASLA